MKMDDCSKTDDCLVAKFFLFLFFFLIRRLIFFCSITNRVGTLSHQRSNRSKSLRIIELFASQLSSILNFCIVILTLNPIWILTEEKILKSTLTRSLPLHHRRRRPSPRHLSISAIVPHRPLSPQSSSSSSPSFSVVPELHLSRAQAPSPVAVSSRPDSAVSPHSPRLKAPSSTVRNVSFGKRKKNDNRIVKVQSVKTQIHHCKSLNSRPWKLPKPHRKT
ncbi:hypothetical protein TorRG33x02_062150 [Trema orientale]|uniref:Transmembrane protein n=1 Tax=Trema orientale TaxID=63057 RepID=A0A2P5FJC7_TREOI|nr:hypothetical protein TorRG33x02_062150 [Trema orientale]